MQSINQSINQIIEFVKTCYKPEKLFDFLNQHSIPFSYIGGMTNQNVLLNISGVKFVLRIPNAVNLSLINREYEAFNNAQAYRAGLNVETPILDAKSGVKLTRYLENSNTLSQIQLNEQSCLSQVVNNLYRLHNSEFVFRNVFSVFDEFRQYFSLLENKSAFYQADSRMDKLSAVFWQFEEINKEIILRPCHNDLVPENMLLQDDLLFFIDWEYSGLNDPLFDIATIIEEAHLSKEAADFLLETYCNQTNKYHKTEFQIAHRRLKIHRFCQNVLWFLWTKVKEEHGENFGDYALKRLDAAFKLLEELP